MILHSPKTICLKKKQHNVSFFNAPACVVKDNTFSVTFNTAVL
uniref:Uncharacterized protein n=1 Tax=Anguilla anguilla TaxID=7936 RepID=A0A0E9RJA1_ANGAN